MEHLASWPFVSLGDVARPTRPRVKPSDYSNLPFIGMEHVQAHTMKLLGPEVDANLKRAQGLRQAILSRTYQANEGKQ